MVTTFKDMGDHYLLNGAKMWISNRPFADLAVVWAKAENTEGRIHGLIVERGMEGFTTPTTHGKLSLRASPTGELVFDNVKVPKANLLPNKSGLGAPARLPGQRPLRHRLGYARRGHGVLRHRRCATARSASSSASPSGSSSSRRRSSPR
jgi:alkylation response protein AidB-like acyl-CoA dehydrogenase